jgi:hypothetical protein
MVELVVELVELFGKSGAKIPQLSRNFLSGLELHSIQENLQTNPSSFIALILGQVGHSAF